MNNNITCVTCNRHLSGNTVEYRIGLIHRIGQANVDWLEGPNEPANLSKADLESIRDEYRRKARELAQWRRAA